MSNTIDQKVVEMRFDNKHFESNVATTMSTLEKLKQKLNFTGASKGLDDISASAKKVNMNGLAAGVETVRAKFSANAAHVVFSHSLRALCHAAGGPPADSLTETANQMVQQEILGHLLGEILQV